MLKVLYLPLNSPEGVQQGMYDAWNNINVKLEIFDFYMNYLRSSKNLSVVRSQFLKQVDKFKPDLIHMQLQFTDIIDNATLKKARALSPNVIITNWSGDIRATAIPNFINLSNALDYSFISSTGQLEMYRKAGCNNVRYWQIGYDPKNSYPVNNKTFKYDVTFIGNNYGNTFPDGYIRLEAANKLRNAFGAKFGIFGGGFPKPWNTPTCNPTEANGHYNNSICALSISNFNSVSHYFSDRLLYCVGSGRPTISWSFPGGDSYFADGSEILFVHTYEELINAVKFCKDNPDKANQIGKNGQMRAFKEHTNTSRILELLHITKLISKV